MGPAPATWNQMPRLSHKAIEKTIVQSSRLKRRPSSSNTALAMKNYFQKRFIFIHACQRRCCYVQEGLRLTCR